MAARRRRRNHSQRVSALRAWLVPMALLGGIAILAFASIYLIDDLFTGGPQAVKGTSGLARYLQLDPDHISDAVTGLTGCTVAVLAIVITVVSLLVQLTSERYTGVAAMFLRDRTNIAVMAYYVISSVFGLATSLSLHNYFVPRAVVLAMMCSAAIGLIAMLPYFAYVFRFLAPTNLVERIERQATEDVIAAATEREPAAIIDGQAPAITALEELTDITSNSISGKDKIIASRSVDAIKDFVVRYFEVKGRAQSTWFEIGERIKDNPDFVAMDPESLHELEIDKTWLEWKALRQYLGIYAEAQSAMPDINYLIAIDTRYIGEAALAHDDPVVVELAFRFMNSYIRAALNARAVRTAYNVMNQYRLLVETLIRKGADDLAVEGVKHMIYYGRTSYDMQLGFVTETVAYDVSALCEYAHSHCPASVSRADLDDKMLEMFLELDQPLRMKRQESGLQGIRKAQIKLACYYLMVGAEDRAKKIAHDMAGEDRERLKVIREQLSKVESKQYWEIIDRGRNFEFMPPKQKEHMERFFAMLG